MNTQSNSAIAPSVFNFEPSYPVRIITINNEPWFVAKDVILALEISWTGTQRIKHVPEKWRGVTSVVTPSAIQQMAILSELGLYFFLNRSDSPKALPFQKKVAEIIATIRKTGKYDPTAAKPTQAERIPLTRTECKRIIEARDNVSRYFCFHLYGAVTVAIYKPILEHYGVTRIEDLNAAELPEVIGILERMANQAHAYYMEQMQIERQAMRQLSACLALPAPTAH